MPLTWVEEREAGGLINQNVLSQECNYLICSLLLPSVCDAPGIGSFLVVFFLPPNKFPVFKVKEGCFL